MMWTMYLIGMVLISMITEIKKYRIDGGLYEPEDE